ncbi:hypothetical protein JTB14_035789 [Gonioctena quinquepunctata]|nr:hypothetical protein JTB14_035789 [Gonioctena quinquepunctata]
MSQERECPSQKKKCRRSKVSRNLRIPSPFQCGNLSKIPFEQREKSQEKRQTNSSEENHQNQRYGLRKRRNISKPKKLDDYMMKKKLYLGTKIPEALKQNKTWDLKKLKEKKYWRVDGSSELRKMVERR